MVRWLLTDRADNEDQAAVQIVCPILAGLTAAQSDCAIVMPIGNANGLLLEALAVESERSEAVELHAGVLCADPFFRPEALYEALRARGMKGVVNWPTSIFLEGSTRSAMATVPARPEQEIHWLYGAKSAGLEATAVILSRDQGFAALEAGLTRLIVHPGLPQGLETGAPLTASLNALVDELRSADRNAELLLYRHPALATRVDFDAIGADGILDYGVARCPI